MMTCREEMNRLEYQLGEIIRLFPGYVNGSHKNLDDLVSRLRVQVKYALLDIEALRRERKFYQTMLARRDDPPPDGIPPYRVPGK